MQFCPLYSGVQQEKPWTNSGANAGLVFNKFPSAWTNTPNWEFDKKLGDPGAWLNEFTQRPAGDADLIKEVTSRQRDLVKSLGGKVFAYKNVSRFVSGMGLAHPLENGLTWHPTLGVPYLPGSSLKGVLRSWELSENGAVIEGSSLNEKGGSKERLKMSPAGLRAFGAQAAIGQLLFFDMLPLGKVNLVREIMTPHYGGYYQDKQIPGDWESPVPIQYLAIEEGCEWQIAVAFQRRDKSIDESFWEALDDLIAEALVWGAGGKTAIGFGSFERAKNAEQKWESEFKKREEARLKEIHEMEAAKRREQEYTTMSEALAEIKRASDSGKWLDAEGGPNAETFVKGLQEYLNARTTLEAEVVDWLRSLFNKRHPTLWSNPDEKTGKKNKPVHKSSWSDLVKKVKSMAAE